MSNKSDRPDVAQLAARDLATSAFPAEGKQAFRVYFDRAIHERLAAHAAEKVSLEVCGVLVGDWRRDDNGPYVLISESVRADKATSNAGDVTFTHEAWNEVNREMDTKFADRKIVGWYHTHPNFGIFLSDRDCFIQDHFFNSPGQVAYVVDPINGVEGVFCWRNGKSKLLPSFWVGGEIHLSSQGKERQPSSAVAADSAPATAPKPEPLPTSSMLTLSLAAVCLLLLGYLLGNMRTEAERRQTEFGAVAQLGLIKGMRPGMREQLDAAFEEFNKGFQGTQTLAKEHIGLMGDKREEKAKQWAETLEHLARAALTVQKVNQDYSLNAEESAAIQQLINQKEADLQNVNAGGEAAKSSGSAAGPKPSAAPAAKPSGAPASKSSENRAASAPPPTH